MDFTDYSKEILKNVGGKSNIKKVTHCFTRLRLDLNDNSLFDKERIDSLEIVKGSQINNGQVQIIIGNDVEDLYNSFVKLPGLSEGTEEAAVENKTFIGRFIDLITGIFVPVFPALVAGGLMKGILIAIMFSGIMDTSGTTFSLLTMFSDAPFYFLPIILAFSASKRFKCNPYIAVVIAGIMLHPTYSTLGDNIQFLGINMSYINYSSTVFPILIGIYLMSWIEKGAKKISPKSISMLLVPLITIFITAPLVLIVVGPLTNEISMIIGNAVTWLFDTVGIFAGAVLGAAYPFLVFTGLHQAIPPIELQNLAQTGVDPILAVAACGNAAVAGATLMVAVKSKKNEFKSLAASSALSAFIGITEPAIYGVVSHFKTTFLASFIGGGIGGAIVALFKVTAVGMGPVPLAGIAVFFGNKFIWYIVGIVVSAVAAMIVVAILGFKEETGNSKEMNMKTNAEKMNAEKTNVEKKETEEKEVREFVINAPLKGTVIPLNKVKDAAFSEGIMGKGLAIIPSEGKVYAPIDGVVSAFFKTKHAIGITGNEAEIIIHVGLDTVKLGGKYFDAYVKEGASVKKGDLLFSFDIAGIEREGYECITPVVISNTSDFEEVTELKDNGEVAVGDHIIQVKKGGF